LFWLTGQGSPQEVLCEGMMSDWPTASLMVVVEHVFEGLVVVVEPEDMY